MKLQESYLKQAYFEAMVTQYTETLRTEGFDVEREKSLNVGASSYRVDLYARKENETRFYEFKLVGGEPAQDKDIQRFKEVAQECGATPFVVYVNVPLEKNIEIDNLDNIILNYFQGNSIPDDLDALSTHTEIDEVQIDELNDIKVTSESITVTGEAIVYVNLVYGSGSDEPVTMSDNFSMTFTIELDHGMEIIDFSCDIDTSDFYE